MDKMNMNGMFNDNNKYYINYINVEKTLNKKELYYLENINKKNVKIRNKVKKNKNLYSSKDMSR